MGYIADKEFKGINFSLEAPAKGEYDTCIFRACDFSDTDLSDFVFLECRFDQCIVHRHKTDQYCFPGDHLQRMQNSWHLFQQLQRIPAFLSFYRMPAGLVILPQAGNKKYDFHKLQP